MLRRLLCVTYQTSRLTSVSLRFSRRSSASLRFSRRSSAFGKMRADGSSSPTGGSTTPSEPVEADGPLVDVSDVAKDTYVHAGRQSSPGMELKNVPTSISCGSLGRRRTKIDLGTLFEQRCENIGDNDSSQFETLPVTSYSSQWDDSLLKKSFGKKRAHSPRRRQKLPQTRQADRASVRSPERNSADSLAVDELFDICLDGRSTVVPATSLLSNNGEELVEMEQHEERVGKILRPGMVLLKSYLTLSEQVQIVKKCQELGLGPAGFYQPIYRDGAKLRLHMMCLGLHWDHETRKYQCYRPFDGSQAASIPFEFNSLVKRAIKDSHALIREDNRESNPEEILPEITPNICIVNFYATSGRLGLHQDRDESKESLQSGLPVVSFSIGDSAEFLFGDLRDADKTEKVLLQSGDVLIFGGQSRHIFHGVSSILPNSAPSALMDKTNLRPGRLNLTFRQY